MVQLEHLEGLIEKIIENPEQNQFRLECLYSDGKDNTILLISFFNIKKSKTYGKITFQHETGVVRKCVYKNHRFKDAHNIVDALLDVYNYQKSGEFSKVKANC